MDFPTHYMQSESTQRSYFSVRSLSITISVHFTTSLCASRDVYTSSNQSVHTHTCATLQYDINGYHRSNQCSCECHLVVKQPGRNRGMNITLEWSPHQNSANTEHTKLDNGCMLFGMRVNNFTLLHRTPEIINSALAIHGAGAGRVDRRYTRLIIIRVASSPGPTQLFHEKSVMTLKKAGGEASYTSSLVPRPLPVFNLWSMVLWYTCITSSLGHSQFFNNQHSCWPCTFHTTRRT